MTRSMRGEVIGMDESGEPKADTRGQAIPLEAAGESAKYESARGSVPGAPTWPMQDPASGDQPGIPPVGLNWGGVARRFGVDVRLLEHDGSIVLAGEFFPAAGYAIDPTTMRARFVDVGELALSHCYHIGELGLRNFRVRLPADESNFEVKNPVIPHTPPGAMIGLFVSEQDARRARERILNGSLGSGVDVQPGQLGFELRVERPVMSGRTCTVMAGHRGAVILIGGETVSGMAAGQRPVATGAAIAPEQADTERPGTGVTSDSQQPAEDWGSSEQLKPL